MKPTITPTMTEYRIVELHRRFHIEESINDKPWREAVWPNVPRYFDSLADARSWVATIKRGVVYHGAEDAPNLAQDERDGEGDTSDGIKPLEWFEERVGKVVSNDTAGYNVAIGKVSEARLLYNHYQNSPYHFRYSDPR